jgi:hypothetical protein
MESLSLDELRKLPEYRSLPPSTRKSKLNVGELRQTIHAFRENKQKFSCKNNYDLTPDEIMNMAKQVMYDYYLHGSRSSKKVDFIHFFICCLIKQKVKQIAPDLYPLMSFMSQPTKEARVKGLLYDKDVDICVRYKRKNIGIVSVKFITSNYNQNSNNYFESLLGECINLKSVNGNSRVFWFSLFTFKDIPYYNKSNEIISYEQFNASKVGKYKILFEESLRNNALPDCVSLTILENTKTMQHPNKLSHKTPEHISQLVDSLFANTYIEYPRLQFYLQLDIFCKKVIDLIKNEYAKLPVKGKRLDGVKSNSK